MSHPSIAELLDFVEGSATEHRAEIEHHLAECNACQATVAEVLQQGQDEPMTIGRFTVLQNIGSGAMGLVFEAHDPQLDRRVAIKLRMGDREPQLEQMVLHEARAMAKVSHPNIVNVYEFGFEGETLFLVMELVEGVSLRTYALDHQHEPSRIIDAFVQAGRGLAASHAAGIVHRDFKPENVLVDREHRARVTDFGLAAFKVERGVAGTLAYIAPEVLAGEPVTAASDQFSFGVALYEALSGQRPWAEIQEATERTWPPPPLPPRVPTRVRRAIERSLARDPGARFRTMDELISALSPTLPWWRSPTAIGVGLALIAIALGLFFVERQRHRCNGREVVEAVWNQGARDRLPADAKMVIPMLDRWAETWADEYRTTCEAGAREDYSRATIEGRTRCLDERLREFSAITRLATERPTSSARLVPTLPDPVLCRSSPPLGSWPPPTLDAKLVGDLQNQLSEAIALNEIGLVGESKSRVDGILQQVNDDTAPELTARATYVRGLLLRVGNIDDADGLMLKVFQRALKADDGELATLAAMSRARIVGPFAGRYEEALAQVEIARAFADRLPPTHRYRTGFHWVWGEVLVKLERFDEAEKVLKEGVELSKNPGSDQYQYPIEYVLADLFFSQGRWDEALDYSRKTLEHASRRVPVGSPGLVTYQVGVALCLIHRAGSSLEVREVLDAATAALKGKDEREVPGLWASLIAARSLEASARGAFDEALEHGHHARRLHALAYRGREAESACNVAFAALSAGKFELTRRALDEGAAAAAAVPAKNQSKDWCAVVESMLDRAQGGAGHLPDGLRPSRVSPPDRFFAFLEEGEIALNSGQGPRAREICESVSEQLTRTPMGPRVTAAALFFCARARVDPAMAKRDLERALPLILAGAMPAHERKRFDLAAAGHGLTVH